MQTAALALSAATVTVAYDASGRRFVPAMLQARVTNIGTINDQFNVDVLDVPGEWVARSVPGMRMRPGIDGTVDLTFQPPRAPVSLAGTHPFRVRVTPQEQPDGYVEFAASLVIEPYIETSLAFVEPVVTTDSDGLFRLRLVNGGNTAVTYALSAPPGEGEPLDISFQSGARAEATTLVTVGPGEAATPELRVSAPPVNGVERPSGPYPFTVQATAMPSADWPALTTPPLVVTGTLVLRPPAPVEVAVEPARVELVDLVLRDATVIVRVTNPSRRRIGVALDAKPPGADYEVKLAADRLVLDPESVTEVELAVSRAPLAPLATAPLRSPFQITVRQVDLPPLTDPTLLPAPVAAPGSVVVTAPPPVEVVIQPPGLSMSVAPKQRRGGVGKYRVTLANAGTQRVKGVLDLDDPDRELDYLFGPQPPRYKRWFRRFFRYGSQYAKTQAMMAVGSRGMMVAQAAGVDTPTGAITEQDYVSAGRGIPVMLEAESQVTVPLEVRPGRARLVGRSRHFPFQITHKLGREVVLRDTAEFEHKPLPLLLLSVIILLLLSPLFIIIPLKWGCDRGTLEFSPYCVPPPIPRAPLAGLLQTGGTDGTTTVGVREGATLAPVASAPSSLLPGQFEKLVAPAPDGGRVLFVTAKDATLAGASLMLADRNGNVSQLKTIEKGLWVAKPVWCQTEAGDPGKIAYVTWSEPSAGRTGLQLRVLTLGGQIDDRVVVEGTSGQRGNGFGPDLFYGGRATPLQWWDGCQSVKYGEAGTGQRWLVTVTGEQPAVSEIRRFSLPGAQPVSAQEKATGTATTGTGSGVTTTGTGTGPARTFCDDKPFAQMDPSWAGRVIGAAGGPTIGANGCTLSAAATVFQYYGAQTNPNQLMGCAGEAADFFQWEEVARKCSAGKVTGTRWKENPSYGELTAAVQAKTPAIVGLAGGQSGSHYLVLAGGGGENGADFRVIDPWDGTSYKRLSDYLSTGSYHLKWLISYQGTAPACAVAPGQETPAVKFRGITDGGSSQTPVKIEYDVPSGARYAASHASGTTFDKDGFYSVSVALEDGAYRDLSFFIDRAAPKTTASFQRDKEAKEKFAGLLTLSAKDTLTPVAVTRFQVNGGEWRDLLGNIEGKGHTMTRAIPLEFEQVGEQRVRMYSIDAAGNREDDTEYVINIEGVPPTPQIVPGGQANFGLTDSQKVVTLTVTGPGVLQWQATSTGLTPQGDWLSVEPAEGAIKMGEQIRLTIRVDRNKLKPGDFVGAVTVASKMGQTDISATVEVVGKQTGESASTNPGGGGNGGNGGTGGEPAPAPTQPAEGGRGAGVGAEEPEVNPATLTIRAADLSGPFTVREKAGARMQWYVVEAPDWLAVEVDGSELIAGNDQSRVLTQTNGATTVAVKPIWNTLRPGETRNGTITIREVSNRYSATVNVTVTR